MIDGVDVAHQYDWEFHQATGMAAVQMDARDMTEAAARLVAVAVEADESVHDTALLVLDGRLRLSSDGWRRTAGRQRHGERTRTFR